MSSYDASKQFLTVHVGVSQGWVLWASCGMTSGLVTTTCAAPIDLVRTREMMASSTGDSVSGSFLSLRA